jgi:hypothetical protein
VWRVRSNEIGDRLKIVGGLRRPPQFSHLAILSLT